MSEFPKTWILPNWPAPANVKALITTREGGHSHGPYRGFNLGDHVGDDANLVRQNREFLERYLPSKPKWLNQVHGTGVVLADQVAPGQAGDAACTRAPNIVCIVMTADCLPVLITDKAGSAVAVAHAGWRGLSDGVIENTIVKFDCNPTDILVYLGPAIGSAAYVVGTEVRDTFLSRDNQALSAFKDHGRGKWHVDLYEIALQRLKKLGVNNIFGGDFCTFSDSKRFFSYRRDGFTGRIASLIWRTETKS